MLGCIGLGLVFWRLADIMRYRKYSFWGLAFSLSLAACLHYFAIFSIGILWLVEVVLLIQSRKLNLSNFTCKSIPFIYPLICLIVHFPLLYHKSKTLPFWKASIQVSELLSMYFEPFINFRCLLMLILIFLLYFAANPRRIFWRESEIFTLAFLFILLLCIFFIFIFALNKNFFQDRYILSYLIGFAIVLSKSLWNIEIRRLIYFAFLLAVMIYITRYTSEFIFP